MKRHWQHPEPDKTGRRYWRSLDEYENSPAHQERLGREFDPGLSSMGDEERESSRREFMKIMGGAAVLSGLTLSSCRRPLEKILPFTKHVEWIIPGKSLLYATVLPRSWGATPVVVTTHEGRPTHLQGNPLHPLGGGLDIFAQASILELYNPDRIKEIHTRKNPGHDETRQRSWEVFDGVIKDFQKQFKPQQADGLGILISPTTSPTQLGLIADLLKAYPKARVYEYEPIHRRQVSAAVKSVLGDGLQMVPRPEKAEVVLSLDCDFVGLDTLADGSVHRFMSKRAPKDAKDKMNRLYVVENRYTLTGGISDHRKPLAASLIPQAAALLAKEVGKLTGDAELQQAASALASGAAADLQAWIAPAAEDLVAHKGKALVLAGSRYDAAVHALVLGINKALGALGPVIDVFKVQKPALHSVEELIADLNTKAVDLLFVLTESDPCYDVPEFKATLVKSPATVLTVALRENLTTKYSTWTIPAAHYLEAWGDARSSDGTYSVVQPMIAPLFNGVSVNDILLALLGRKQLDPNYHQKLLTAALAKDPKAQPQPDPAYLQIKETFGKIAGGWDLGKWDMTLRDGYLVHTAYVPEKGDAGFKSSGVTALLSKFTAPKAPTPDAPEVVLTPDATLWDGRYVDNPWLQEAPDPITKLTWDNAAWMSPRTFRALGLKKGEDINEIIEVKVGDKKLEIVAIECPGHAHDSITIPLGYGQEVTALVGKKTGFNGFGLRNTADEFVLSGAKVTPTGKNYELAITQDNYTMEGRAQVREATKERFEKDETFAKTEGMDAHAPPNLSLYKGQVGIKSAENPSGFDYENLHQWGMVIDLAKCIGCSACIVACQSENNIPIVGKDQVRRGRVMHWIRMDRYFATSGGVEDRNQAATEELDNPELVSQPVACQNCEAAPCETVCPVNATVHTEEGLNAMAYNRCIGTRYCANNCPYIARRFNWFDYNKRNPLIETQVPIFGTVRNLYAGPLGELKPQEVIGLQKNPNVTVRMRGVIEKCTYCVQRLEETKINQRRIAKDDPTKLRAPADSVKTACQASCPAHAIMFGDIANKESSVVRWKANPRNYQVLQYIGTRPRTSYLARIRNVNPKMPDDRKVKTGEASLNNV